MAARFVVGACGHGQGISTLAAALISVKSALTMITNLPRALTFRTAKEFALINDELKTEVVQREQREYVRASSKPMTVFVKFETQKGLQ